MDKKVMDTLHAMLCGEIEDIAKKGTLSHETLDVLKDLVETEKNLEKIKKYKKEEESEWEDKGYSQRKYFIDADYQPGMGHSYGSRDMYDMRNSYGYSMGRVYDGGRSYMDGGNSYMYYDPRYEMPIGRGYSRTSKTEMVEELQKMMNEATDESVKKAIQEAITKMNK
jgi:hypothetical protein